MKTLKSILTQLRTTANKTSQAGYNSLWLQRSKQDGKEWINQPFSIGQAVEDKSTEYIYNVWVKCTDEGVEEMDKFVETELIPNGLSLFIDRETNEPIEYLAKDKSAVRFMIARSGLES
jgi:hypothetical protein